MIPQLKVVGEGDIPSQVDLDYRVGILDRRRTICDLKQRKDGRVDAHAEGQREDDHRSETGMLTQHPRAEAQVLPKVSNHIALPVCSQHSRFFLDRALDSLQFSLKRFALAQLRERNAISLFRRRATCQRLRVAILQMLREFLDDLYFARRL